jgi:hypothetical protein
MLLGSLIHRLILDDGTISEKYHPLDFGKRRGTKECQALEERGITPVPHNLWMRAKYAAWAVEYNKRANNLIRAAKRVGDVEKRLQAEVVLGDTEIEVNGVFDATFTDEKGFFIVDVKTCSKMPLKSEFIKKIRDGGMGMKAAAYMMIADYNQLKKADGNNWFVWIFVSTTSPFEVRVVYAAADDRIIAEGEVDFWAALEKFRWIQSQDEIPDERGTHDGIDLSEIWYEKALYSTVANQPTQPESEFDDE